MSAGARRMRPEVAARRIVSFRARFGETHLTLAWHAAFPLTVTPDLLYHLWASFQTDVEGRLLRVPWVAVADLLLSGLCSEVGHDAEEMHLFEMDLEVRAALLGALEADPRFGARRMRELSAFLLEYVRHQAYACAPESSDLAMSQRWTALAYVQPGEAAREMAEAFARAGLEDRPELVRVASVVEALEPALPGFTPLVAYAKGMAAFARKDVVGAAAHLDAIATSADVEVAGIKLPFPPQTREMIGIGSRAFGAEEKESQTTIPDGSPLNRYDPALYELRRRYRDGDLVLFVGAGVSAAAGLPSWSQLVDGVLSRAKARGANTDAIAEVEQLLARGHHVDALSAAAHAAGPQETIAAVRSALDDRHHGPELPEIAEAIAALEPRLRAVLTTNLDLLMERTFGGRWPVLHRATGNVAQERQIILKLHGTLADPETWVLTREQYDRAMYRDPRLKGAVDAVFRARTLLFVGYGLADDDFDAVLGGLRALSHGSPPRHFALVPAAEVTPHWRRVREDAGVHVIPYDGYGEVPAILRWLAREDASSAEALVPGAALLSPPPAVPAPPAPTPFRFPPAPPPPPPDAPYDARFYVHRREEEQRALDRLAVPGSPVVLWAPARFGSTSTLRYLMERVEAEDAELGRPPPLILETDLGALLPDRPEDVTPDGFFRSFARHLLREVGAGAAFDGIEKDSDAWSNKLRDLMEDYVLPRAPGRFVLALDRADALWGHAGVQGEFYRALRAWKDRAHKLPWSKLRLVLLISTTPALVFDDPSHPESLFYNLTADFIELREYTPDQTVELAHLHGLAWDRAVVDRDVRPLVGGHPYLLRTLMYRARLTGAPLASLTSDDDALDRLFEQHVGELARLVERDPALHKAFVRLLDDPQSPIQEDQFVRLRRAGLVTRTTGGISVSNKLYESYFRRRWRTKRSGQ